MSEDGIASSRTIAPKPVPRFPAGISLWGKSNRRKNAGDLIGQRGTARSQFRIDFGSGLEDSRLGRCPGNKEQQRRRIRRIITKLEPPDAFRCFDTSVYSVYFEQKCEWKKGKDSKVDQSDESCKGFLCYPVH